MTVTIWHNPRCSKSRETLDLIRDRGVGPQVRFYLDDPPTAGELQGALDRLGLAAPDLVRRGEPLFRELGLGIDADEATLLAAMAAHPKLIERPVVIRGDRAVIGRPPLRVLDLLD